VQPIYEHVNFHPNQETTVLGKKGNADAWLPAGGAFYVEPINDCWTAGVSVVGYFGAKLTFNHDWVGRYYLTKTTLQGFSFAPAVSCRVTDKLSVGVGVQLMYAIFSQKAAVNNVLDNLPDGSLKVKDDDFSTGAIVGVLYEFTSATRIGVQYLSEVKLHFNCTARFQNIGPTLSNSAAGKALVNSKVFLDVFVPQCIMLSGYHDLSSCLAVMANVGWQEWSKFQKATIVFGDPAGTSLTSIPKYKNTWHAAFGARYRHSCELAFTAGVAYDSSAVSNVNRPLDFPVGQQWLYGAGAEYAWSDKIKVGIQYAIQCQGDLSVDVNRGPLAGHVAGKYKNVTGQFINCNLQMVF
jgi:long-chain fatty acid transport protein